MWGGAVYVVVDEIGTGETAIASDKEDIIERKEFDVNRDRVAVGFGVRTWDIERTDRRTERQNRQSDCCGSCETLFVGGLR